jgi:hypothetical protein
MKAGDPRRLRKGRRRGFDVKADGSVLGRDDAAAVPIPLDGVSASTRASSGTARAGGSRTSRAPNGHRS